MVVGGAGLAPLLLPRAVRAAKAELALATFSADVTVPVGHPLMGGGVAAANSVADRLQALGIVLLGGSAPVVIVAVDWCEIRNDAYQQWRELLAEAARTTADRVLVSSVHQHDAPVADLQAERILRTRNLTASVCDPQFHAQAVRHVAAALRAALPAASPVTHIGLGQAEVERIASNRRYHAPDGTLRFDRTSATKSEMAQQAELGGVDPWLKTLSFWNNDRAVAALHAYATHPMSYYGRGEVSADFVGLARRRRQQDDPSIHQMYLSGASGNVTAGKFNDGSPANRAALAERLYQAIDAAWRNTERHRLQHFELATAPVRLAPRSSPGFTTEDLEQRLATPGRPFEHCLAALGLSWRQRMAADRPVEISALDLGPARYLLLPGESYVEFQLRAQQLAGDAFVMTAGYGECATGYVPIEQAWREGDTNLGDWCWVDPGAEQALEQAMKRLLLPTHE